MDLLVQHMNLQSLRALAVTCHQYQKLVAEHYQRLVYQIIYPFTRSPQLFVATLESCHAVISGPLVLAALVSPSMDSYIMDIYVPATSASKLHSVLVTVFGYEEENDAPGTNFCGDHSFPSREIMDLSRLVRVRRRIHVFTVRGNPLVAIFGFKSTIPMNFISANGIFCGYPKMTLERKGLINQSAPLRESTIKRCRFYDELGFNHLPSHPCWLGTHTCGKWSSCPLTLRNLYDRGGMFLEFQRSDKLDWRGRIRYDDSGSVTWLLDCGAACGAIGAVERGFRYNITALDLGFRP